MGAPSVSTTASCAALQAWLGFVQAIPRTARLVALHDFDADGVSAGVIPVDPGDGSYSNGHDEASGGSLSVERWNDFLARLGFPPSAFTG